MFEKHNNVNLPPTVPVDVFGSGTKGLLKGVC
jgi:hypothetical protein